MHAIIRCGPKFGPSIIARAVNLRAQKFPAGISRKCVDRHDHAPGDRFPDCRLRPRSALWIDDRDRDERDRPGCQRHYQQQRGFLMAAARRLFGIAAADGRCCSRGAGRRRNEDGPHHVMGAVVVATDVRPARRQSAYDIDLSGRVPSRPSSAAYPASPALPLPDGPVAGVLRPEPADGIAAAVAVPVESAHGLAAAVP